MLRPLEETDILVRGRGCRTVNSAVGRDRVALGALCSTGQSFSLHPRSPQVGRRIAITGGDAYLAPGLATLTDRICGNTYGRTFQDFPASGLTNNWPVVVPT